MYVLSCLPGPCCTVLADHPAIVNPAILSLLLFVRRHCTFYIKTEILPNFRHVLLIVSCLTTYLQVNAEGPDQRLLSVFKESDKKKSHAKKEKGKAKSSKGKMTASLAAEFPGAVPGIEVNSSTLWQSADVSFFFYVSHKAQIFVWYLTAIALSNYMKAIGHAVNCNCDLCKQGW